ncbi:hypothetical protein [Methylobacterium sp. E-045]|uniref:hypothetical protein n=1 Tax=Methylobacterium sp. E-045 TaxID=2836575 RepID=UPI001FB9A806|nr:hypothetical protein [Methylobacterium sp. E-045]MCJ2130979.1 hypothetical protein [Methylobacterium sp. E-045]
MVQLAQHGRKPVGEHLNSNLGGGPMFNWFDAAMAQRVDDLTLHHCERTRALGELKQLARLFGKGYLRALHSEMTAGLITQGGPARVLQIKLAWIDKIPLAKPFNRTKKTELGDAVLLAIEEQRIAGQPTPVTRRARAVLLQAKVTQRYAQTKRPTVPISPMAGSTKDEYELLSAWPEFDLYKTSGNTHPLATAINLNAAKTTPQPFGWYVGAPRCNQIPSNVTTTWPSWWMLGPSIQGDGCVVSFGAFLRSFLCNSTIITSSGPLAAGEPFNYPSNSTSKASLTGWDRVCAEIIDIVEDKNMPAPQSIFGANTSRIVSMDEIHLSFIAPMSECNSYLSWLPPGNPRALRFFRGPHERFYPLFPDQYPQLPADIFVGWHASQPGRPRSSRNLHRRTPVLIFRSVIYEGEG